MCLLLFRYKVEWPSSFPHIHMYTLESSNKGLFIKKSKFTEYKGRPVESGRERERWGEKERE